MIQNYYTYYFDGCLSFLYWLYFWCLTLYFFLPLMFFLFWHFLPLFDLIWHWMENPWCLLLRRENHDQGTDIHQHAEAGTKHTRWILGTGTQFKKLIQIIILTWETKIAIFFIMDWTKFATQPPPLHKKTC